MAYVKCSICGKTFNREKESYVKTSSTRYAHKACGEPFLQEKEKENKEAKDKEMLNDYIKQIYQIEQLSPLMRKQVKRFHDELGFTYSGMCGALAYFYNVQGHTTEKARGVGILEYIYEEAKQYYVNLAKINLANEGVDFSIPTRVVSIQPPQPQKKKKRFFRLFEGDD